MQTIAHQIDSPLFRAKLSNMALITLGSFFLALCSQISIPLTPVPMSGQTFAIYLLALTLGGKRATFATLLYLGYATMGFPVLAGGMTNPLWMFGPKVGYLIGFPLATLVIGKLVEMKEIKTIPWMFFSTLSGMAVIFLLGTSCLSGFIGWSTAIKFGLLPFLLIDFLKVILATSAASLISK